MLDLMQNGPDVNEDAQNKENRNRINEKNTKNRKTIKLNIFRT